MYSRAWMLILTFLVVLLPVGAATTADTGRVVKADSKYYGAWVIKYTQTPRVQPRDVVEITRGGVPVCEATVLSTSGKYVLVMPRDGEPSPGDVVIVVRHLGQPANVASSVPQPHYAQDGSRTRAVAGEHVGGSGSSNGYYLTPTQAVDPNAGAAATAPPPAAPAPSQNYASTSAAATTQAYAPTQAPTYSGVTTIGGSAQAQDMAPNSATSMTLGSGPYYNASYPALGTPVSTSGYAGYSGYPTASYGATPYGSYGGYGAYSPYGYGYSPYYSPNGFGTYPYGYATGALPNGTVPQRTVIVRVVVPTTVVRPAAAPRRTFSTQTFSSSWHASTRRR